MQRNHTLSNSLCSIFKHKPCTVSSASRSGVEAQNSSPCSCSMDLLFRSEEHTSEIQSLMRTSYAVFCLKKKNPQPAIKKRKTNIQNYRNQNDYPPPH